MAPVCTTEQLPFYYIGMRHTLTVDTNTRVRLATWNNYWLFPTKIKNAPLQDAAGRHGRCSGGCLRFQPE